MNENWVLTAAHCVRGVQNDLFVKAGKLLINDKEDTEQVVKVAKYIEHEKYPG